MFELDITLQNYLTHTCTHTHTQHADFMSQVLHIQEVEWAKNSNTSCLSDIYWANEGKRFFLTQNKGGLTELIRGRFHIRTLMKNLIDNTNKYLLICWYYLLN